MTSFLDMNLSPEILKALQDQGFDKPTEIQAQTLPILLDQPTDFLGLAATGTGKTAAFAIPLLERIDPTIRAVQALILCPTRELALQVSGQIELLGKYKKIRSVAVYGGASYTDQIHGLKQGASIVVGTPGRVVDHMNRGNLKLDQLQTLILDEADEMISMGFREEMERILESVPSQKSHIWFFSATMDKQVGRIVQNYLKNPKQVQINKKEMLSSKVEQLYYMVRESDKPEILCKLIESAEEFYGLVFCQTKQLVTDLTSYLVERGHKVDCLHGDKDQNARERTMQSFRDRKVKILICTDVASRGLDVKDVSHVINYSLPRELDNYVHRIGRTARSGKAGIAMNLVTPSHRRLIWQIEDLTKSRMQEGKIPTRKEVGARKMAQILPKFSEQAMFTRALEILGDEWKTALSEMSSEEVAARFLSLMMPDLFTERAEKPRSFSNEGQPLRQDSRDSGRGNGDRYDRNRSSGGSSSRVPSRYPSRERRADGGQNDRYERSGSNPSEGRPAKRAWSPHGPPDRRRRSSGGESSASTAAPRARWKDRQQRVQD